MTGSLRAADFVDEFPDDEIVVYRNHVIGYECLVLIPRAKLMAIEKAGIPLDKASMPLPLWRHGDVINVREARG